MVLKDLTRELGKKPKVELNWKEFGAQEVLRFTTLCLHAVVLNCPVDLQSAADKCKENIILPSLCREIQSGAVHPMLDKMAKKKKSRGPVRQRGNSSFCHTPLLCIDASHP